MPIYVTVAYVVFSAVPLGLAVSTYLRRKRVVRELRRLEATSSEGHALGRQGRNT